MTTHGEVSLFYRDADYRAIGQVPTFISLDLMRRFNASGVWNVIVPRSAYDPDARGIIVRRRVDGVTSDFLTGPITGFRRVKRGQQNSMELWGHDDTGWLWRRYVSPQPADYPPFTTSIHNVQTSTAENNMRSFVSLNLGPTARPDRRLQGLAIAPDEGRGRFGTHRGRFQVLGDLLNEIALLSALGFRIVQTTTDPPGLEFQVYVPRDLANVAMFSEGLGNLVGYEHFGEAFPNDVLVGGGGEGTTRAFTERWNVAGINEWGRFEQFLDQRQSTDQGELAAAGDAALTEAAEGKVGVGFDLIDTQAVKFGRDYNLGDRVRVTTDVGEMVDVVREVHFVMRQGGSEAISVVVGTPGTLSPQTPRSLQRLAQVFRQLRNLEVR